MRRHAGDPPPRDCALATEIMNLRDFSHSTPVKIDTSEKAIELSVNDVLKWIAPGAPPGEAIKFLLTCQVARLNPLLREIYLIPMGQNWGTVIAKDGYLRRAQKDPNYAGYEAGITVMQQDPKTKMGALPMHDIEGGILPPGYLLAGGWARAWRKGEEKPYYQRVSFTDFRKDTAIWKSIPAAMIRKVALAAVLREAFGLGGAYDAAEFDDVMSRSGGRPVDVTPQAARLPMGGGGTGGGVPALEALYKDAPDPHLGPDQVKRIYDLAERVQMSRAQLEDILLKRGVSDVADLSPADGSFLIAKLEEAASRAPVVDAFPGRAAHAPSAAFSGGGPDEEAGSYAPVADADARGPEESLAGVGGAAN